jgi:hypothetical protein
MRLFPIMMLMLVISVLMLQQANMRALQGATLQQKINADAQFFLNYRQAVMAYVQANPASTGTIPASSLATYETQPFSSTFLALVGNNVTTTVNGPEVTVYGAMPAGVLTVILNQSGDDASIGLSSGTTWTSQANGVVATAQPLPVAVPSGDIVSVFTM